MRTPEVTRAAILGAATRVFASRGFVGASMRDITDASGISKPVIYYHFGSKEKLYVAVKQSLIADRDRQGVEVDRSDERPADPRAELRGLFEAFRDSEALLRICAWSRLEEGSTGGPGKTGLMKALGRRLELAQERRVIPSDIDPGNLAIMLVGLVAFWLEGHPGAVGVVEGGPDEPAYLRQAIAMVERGLSPNCEKIITQSLEENSNRLPVSQHSYLRRLDSEGGCEHRREMGRPPGRRFEDSTG